MEDFLNHLEEAAEASDIKELERLSSNLLYLSFWQSLQKELTETAYFPELNPEFSDSFDLNKSRTEQQKEALGSYCGSFMLFSVFLRVAKKAFF